MPAAPIRKILIANRGEIARRIIRTAREMGIATVAVFSDADHDAPHVQEADHAVRLAGSAPADTYLRGDLIIAAARATDADAIHPGYGFLSEHAGFAAECQRAGITFIGPPAKVIESMGSKVGAKQLMASAGVPVLAGFTVTPTTTPTELRVGADEIGYPVMAKASFGGGGRGMRVIRSADQVEDDVASAQREALAAFGDGTVFLERYVDAPRHIEVQIFGDHTGRVISLFERECSIQRRHQKIIEEAPSPALSPTQRDELCAAARAAGKSLGYVGAGTVEFVMDQAGQFFFLEVNTRLQVEHPVTEMITGLDLVRLQIEVAQGRPLPDAAVHARINGHAIEARLYAEDVPAGFVPASGPIHRLRVDGDVRVDAGYEAGSTVGTFYDAMVAKVISWAPSRDQATTQLASALARAEIHGVVTNRDLLVNTLRHRDFLAGHTDTAFLERNDAAVLGAADTRARHLHAVAASLAPASTSPSPQPAGLPRTWRNVGVSRAVSEYLAGDVAVSVVIERTRSGIRASVDGEVFVPVGVAGAEATMVDVELLGVRDRVRLHQVGSHIYADSASGASDLFVVDRFPVRVPQDEAGSLLAPMPGTVIAVHVAAGDAVAAGQVLVVIEAMKMEHSVRCPRSGVVADVRVDVGDQVDNGAVLAVIEAD